MKIGGYSRINTVISFLSYSVIFFFFLLGSANAASLIQDETSNNPSYSSPSVEDNIAKMDRDGNGFVDVHEIRAYLEMQHGKDYQKEMLDKMETSMKVKSCGSTFAKDLYRDNQH